MTEDTLFSRIAQRELPADIVFQDDRVTAFRDINPQAPTHILIIPTRSYRLLTTSPNLMKQHWGTCLSLPETSPVAKVLPTMATACWSTVASMPTRRCCISHASGGRCPTGSHAVTKTRNPT
ncbi:MAG: hypothetical protein CM1200mP18_07540 [Gammaproteobacteria bacterium]|nr:MAG: hypothetical protein CM1200mP18_07540 [Gammaproteobacteria bacterium]